MIPALDVLPSQRLSPHSEISEQRAVGLWRLAVGKTSITITPVASALLRTESADFYRQLALTVRAGEEIPLEDLLAHLESIGYEKRDPVEMVGEYSLRGGILDIFPAEASKPIRIELFGDLIESIRRFDVETQRSVMKIAETTLLPLVEYPRSRELFRQIADETEVPSPGDPFPGWEFLVPLVRPRKHSLFSLGENPLIVLDEPEQIATAAKRLWKRLEEPDRHFPALRRRIFTPGPSCRRAGIESRTRPPRIRAAQPAVPSPRPRDGLAAIAGFSRQRASRRRRSAEPGGARLPRGVLREVAGRSWSVWPTFSRSTQFPSSLAWIRRMRRGPYLAERPYMAGAAASTLLVKGLVRRGVVFPEARIAVFGSEDLFDTSDLVAKPTPGKAQLAAFTADLADLKPGDYVVHVTHGIGRFLGTREITQGENKGDFMLLEYAADAKLYVPLTRMDLIQKYRGAGEGSAPPLDRLGGATWDAHQIARQSPNARHGRRAAEALRATPDGRRFRVSRR